MKDETIESVKWMRGKPYYRTRLSSGTRPAVLLAVDPTDVDAVAARARAISSVLARLRDAGRVEFEEHCIRKIAGATTAQEMEGHIVAYEAICAGLTRNKPRLTGAMPFQEFGEMWTNGELAKLFPRHIKTKKSARADAGWLGKYVYPVVSKVPLSAFTLEHGQEVLRRVPDGKSEYTARHVAQCMYRLLRLAVYPARLLAHSPLPRGFLPLIGDGRAKTYLYPREDAMVLGCRDLLVVVRLLYGFLAREGCRVQEALTLDFQDVDLEHGEIHLDHNKTNDPRSWALGGDVVEALRRFRDHFHPNPVPSARIFVYPATSREAGEPIENAARACEFRDNLKLAGLTRPQLFMNDDDRRHIVIHDLRATFVTIALATGKTETWVSDRTGHRSSQQIHGYRRQARTHTELKLGVLGPLHEAIPELRDAARVQVTYREVPPAGGTSGERHERGENQMRSEVGETMVETMGPRASTVAGADMIFDHLTHFRAWPATPPSAHRAARLPFRWTARALRPCMVRALAFLRPASPVRPVMAVSAGQLVRAERGAHRVQMLVAWYQPGCSFSARRRLARAHGAARPPMICGRSHEEGAGLLPLTVLVLAARRPVGSRVPRAWAQFGFRDALG